MTEQNKHFPYEITSLESSQQDAINTHYKGHSNTNVLVGPNRYFMPAGYRKVGPVIYNLPLRNNDVFVVTFPRSGTTWTQELVWLIANDLDFAKAKAVSLTDRYSYIEMHMFYYQKVQDILMAQLEDPSTAEFAKAMMKPPTDVLAEMSVDSQRFVKSHLPLSLLPEKLLDTCKVVYVARDPRDVSVSFYHFTKNHKILDYVGEFNDYFELFKNNHVNCSPVFEHVKEAWEKRNHPNMLFLFYEELSKDLPSVARRVADFFGKEYTDEQIARLCEHLRFDNFQANNAIDPQFMRKVGVFEEKSKVTNDYVRKGKAGGWRDTFDAQTAQLAERWIEHNLRDTDLRFPSTAD